MHTIVTVIRNTASLMTISLDTWSGDMTAARPMTKAIVTTLEASPFPRASSSAPSANANSETMTSGIAARVETTSIPMTKRLMPSFWESAMALSVMNWAPLFNTRKPTAASGRNTR